MLRERAQVSIEFILIAGAFVLMAIIMMPYIFREFELTKAVAAARDGAEFAVSMIGMGYSTPSGTLGGNISGAIKVKNITLIDNGACGGAPNKKWYQIRFYIYAPSHMSYARQNLTMTIRNYAGGNIYRAFHATYNPTIDPIETDRYCFTTAVTTIYY